MIELLTDKLQAQVVDWVSGHLIEQMIGGVCYKLSFSLNQ